ncbi:hypothetical protein PRUPE_5G140900 [Prunus persica]|uniref:RING-type E3 ubiquitin transferase n=1 Tax=Prunus persica TaxID=3760 RepID=A0A251P888_PRUPE|nr:E3 ubiquitin-protein ligase ORTHRUS 2 [Prunus persica]ONI07807.1 hypothetical protein PRUPE_5G140900 [Prunus persica]
MAYVSHLPCDGDGVCMLCKTKPSDEDKLTCKTCVTPWHVACLVTRPESLASTLQWECPDCTTFSGESPAAPAVNSAGSGELVAAIRAIENDESLTEQEKAKKRQELLSGKAEVDEDDGGRQKGGRDVLDVLDKIFYCCFCMQLPERPVTTPCGHNFCLKCFQKWVGQGKRTCAKCRNAIPPKMASQPRINSSLVVAIRMAKVSKSNVTGGPAKIYQFIQNQDRPDKAYTTDRAQKTGKANAASGKIFVTIPSDHFGPIPAENDPERNRGVLVGESWEDRLECRQWGVHFPHVSGIAGQSNHGAQSVVLSGGYLDDEDHGEWFLYTGSGGRDLSGNKRTNKEQSFDQTFDKYNKALQVSCLKGYPVRVVRSHKEKRSSYAPEKGVRYDGCYRIEKCWKKVGVQGFKVCRYLFVRCDNEPAPWTSDEHGDRPRPLPPIPELKQATDITERKQSPSWDFVEKDGCWTWKKPAPVSKKPVQALNPDDRKRSRKAIRKAHNTTVRDRLLKEFSCQICRQVMTSPITTPCAHNFCKLCLEGAFAGKSFVRERNRGGRSLRSQKNVMNCPSCPTDISDFLQNPQVNREIMDMIESLKSTNEEEPNVDPPEESSEEGMADSDNEASTQMSEGKVVNDGGQNSPSTHKSTRSPKRVKFDLGDCSTKTDDGEENEIPAVQADGLEGDSELGNPKESNKSVAPVAKHGRKAVGQEALEEEAMGDDEGNGSPSSPLQVQSDEDPKESNKSEAPVAKCGRKAAGQAGVGAKTRGRKKAPEEEALEDDEGNGSPSSPLQVKSVEDAKESKKSVAPVAKREKKAAVQGGVAARTRGRKKAQEEEALGDDEGNVSPSSPLHVKTDDDFE